MDISRFSWMGYVGVALLVIGIVAACTVILLDPESDPRRRWARYEGTLEKEVRFLLYKTTGKRIARIQLGICVGLAVLAGFLTDPMLLIPIPIVAFAPLTVLRSRHQERLLKLEITLDTWLLLLANSLKAVPSLGEAMGQTAKLMRAPWSEELDLLLKELALGTPLDGATMNMSVRINSRIISGSLATILVGRQTGGDLGRILEESANTLREMQRLEGVVRTKTAEGKSQAFVLGAIPFVLLGAIYWVDNHWLEPLGKTSLGFIIIGVATGLWLTAILMARRILAVDV